MTSSVGSAIVLVTGAGGFIGSHLAADQRRRGRRVRALDVHLDRVRHLEAPDSFELLEGDVGDRDLVARACRGVDVIFHLAAAHLEVDTGEREFERINVGAVRTLTEEARRAGVRRFVHCSSVGVYGRVENPPADEDSPCRPDLAYERTKLEGEGVVLAAVSGSALPAVILRPVWVYGPGCPRTEKLFRTIAKGRFLVAGRGDAQRHCVYIRDMVDAFERASIAPEAPGQVIIVGDGGAVPVRTLVDEIARVVGARPPRSVPLAALDVAGRLAELAFRPLRREPPLSRRTLKFFTNNTAFDIARARRVLGYEPRWDLRAGLEDTHRILASGWRRVPLPDAAAS